MTVHNRKPRRSPRKTLLLNVWLEPLQKRRLKQLAETTGLDQSKLVRRALGLLFDAFNRGQLELGFPDSMRTESVAGTGSAEL